MKHWKSALVLWAATAALGGGTVAVAADAKAPPAAKAPVPDESSIAAVFAKLDADQDQRVSVVEARTSRSLPAAFARLDANQDGFLTPTEFALWEDAGNLASLAPADPTTAPSGSSGAQHMPKRD